MSTPQDTQYQQELANQNTIFAQAAAWFAKLAANPSSVGVNPLNPLSIPSAITTALQNAPAVPYPSGAPVFSPSNTATVEQTVAQEQALISQTLGATNSTGWLANVIPQIANLPDTWRIAIAITLLLAFGAYPPTQKIALWVGVIVLFLAITQGI